MAQQKTKEQMDAEFNAYEDEHCAHLAEIGRLAREKGYNVPGAGKLPALNPDGSYVDRELEQITDDDDDDEPDELNRQP